MVAGSAGKRRSGKRLTGLRRRLFRVLQTLLWSRRI
jgi:hypothetical protein